jgi:hypothetical protein
MIEKKVSIHQPSYWPWLGLLAKIAKSDLYVYLDSVDSIKDHYLYRNIFFCNGESKYLTLPVNYTMGKPIRDLEFLNANWKNDHINKLRNYYRKAPFVNEVLSKITPFYSIQNQSVADFILETMKVSFEVLNINVAIIKSYSLNLTGKKGDLVLSICKETDATEYIAGMGSFDYMKEVIPEFEKEGIKISWHKYAHPFYMQDPGYPFVPGLACLDLFFYKGFDDAKEIFWDSVKNEATV